MVGLSALEETGSQFGQTMTQAVGCGAQRMVYLQQKVGDQGRKYLNFNGIFASAEKLSDFQVLLQPLKEQLNAPARFVALGNDRGRRFLVIGSQHQRWPSVFALYSHAT